jgi:tRNA-Thr(GGU) m(6)t(6)A37 methyltransferase TsaA
MAEFKPIGLYRCPQTYRYEAPRQGVFSGNEGIVELNENAGFEDALRDLAGFSRIWILFEFHLNETWRPMVRPPVSPGGRRIGVFATRSPHRPNRLGMSCVRLLGVDGLRIFVGESDLLDRTPVLDIKPYIPKADAFPDARTGWLEETRPDLWQVTFEEEAREQIALIRSLSGLDLENFCRIQLSLDPLSSDRKRITEENNGKYAIGCRTWQAVFSVSEREKSVRVLRIRSHYTEEELAPGAEDKYGDKDQHRVFRVRFPGRA